jgi:hypothetical protein
MPGGMKRNHRWEAALAALLSEKTLAEAAAKAAISERTLKGWLRESDFRAAYAEARREVLERTVARLLAVTGKAVEALERNLTAERPADQLRAAALTLEHAVRGVEVLDLAEQVEEVRRSIEGLKTHGAGDAEA